MLIVNPYRTEKKKVGKARKGKKKGNKVGDGAGARNLRLAAVYDDLPNGGKLKTNDRQEYKVYEYGNFPIKKINVPGQGIKAMPRAGMYRLMLPADADWTERKKEVDEENKDDVDAMLENEDVKEKREKRDLILKEKSVLKNFHLDSIAAFIDQN